MKGIYVIAVAFLASWNVCSANEDEHSIQKTELPIYDKCPYPDINPGNTTTNIAHESDCTKFYKCLLGRGTEQDCPLMWKDDPEKKRLHYNRALQVCDWPWEAGCELCPGKDNDGKYPRKSLIQDPNDKNCRQYIICKKDGSQETRSCPSGQCFSRTCQKCVKHREGGKCDNLPQPTEDPLECVTGNRKKHDCDCSKYYQCYDNKDWILQVCKGGLHFSATEKECTTADVAKCKPSPKD